MCSNSGVFTDEAGRRGAGTVCWLDFVFQPLVDSKDIAPIMENIGFSPLKMFLMPLESPHSGQRSERPESPA